MVPRLISSDELRIMFSTPLCPIPWCTSVIVKSHSSKSWQELNDIKHWKEGTPLTHPGHTRFKLCWKLLFQALDALASRFMYDHNWHTQVPMFPLITLASLDTPLPLFFSQHPDTLHRPAAHYRALWASPHTSHALIPVPLYTRASFIYCYFIFTCWFFPRWWCFIILAISQFI